MKQRFWWALSVVMLLCLFVVLGAGAEEKTIVAQGTCGAQGDNLTWTLDGEGTLTISGEGEMKDYWYTDAPWKQASTDIKSVIVEEGVTSIGDNAFYDCSSLANLTLPSGLVDIGEIAFAYCTSLENITLPDSVTSIGMTAFNGCSSLTSVILPDGLTSIGSWAFGGCSLLTNVEIPESVTSIGDYAFMDTTRCNVPLETNTAKALSKSGHSFWDGDLAYQYEYDGDNITGLSVVGCDPQITEVVIPTSVTSIGNNAFQECSTLTSVSIPKSVTSIGDFAFFGCSSLISVDIPESVTSIGNSVFNSCNTLTSVSIPSGVTSIGNWVFANCSALTSVSIPVGMTSIGEFAFYRCSSLSNINFPEGIENIGYFAFSGCVKLTEVELPISIKTLGSGAFDAYVKIHAKLDSDVAKTLGQFGYSFWDENLKYCYFPQADGHSELELQGYDVPITALVIPEGVTRVARQAFFYDNTLVSVKMPESVTVIGEWAFAGCSELRRVELAEGLKEIKDSAFYNCPKLLKMAIPASVQKVEDAAITGRQIICYSKNDLQGGPNGVVTSSPDILYCWENAPIVSLMGECTPVKVVYLDTLLDEHGEVDWSKAESALLIEDYHDMIVGESYTIGWELFADTDAPIVWESSAPDIVPVDDNGTITAKKTGFCWITATCDGLSAACIIESYIPIERMEVEDVYLPIGYTMQLEIKTFPENAGDTIWMNVEGDAVTEADAEATGDWRAITAQAIGGAKITVYPSHSGASASAIATVTDLVEDVSMTTNAARGKAGETVQLTAEATAGAEKYENELMLFTSSAPEIAQVNRHGVVTLLAPGTATITATAMGNEALTASCTVTVVVAENAELMLPANLLVVEEEAFANVGATAVILPEGCQRIESRAFADSSVTSIKIPASVTSIADDAFAGCAVTISAPEDSFAMNWAKEHGVPYIVE